jgi:hypothetical protein
LLREVRIRCSGCSRAANYEFSAIFRGTGLCQSDDCDVTSFGPTPIPQTPGAIQASFVAREASGPRAREKAKPQEADAPRTVIRDEVRISDPLKSEEIDPKPDAADEWKHRRNRDQRSDRTFELPKPRSESDGEPHLDVRG